MEVPVDNVQLLLHILRAHLGRYRRTLMKEFWTIPTLCTTAQPSVMSCFFQYVFRLLLLTVVLGQTSLQAQILAVPDTVGVPIGRAVLVRPLDNDIGAVDLRPARRPVHGSVLPDGPTGLLYIADEGFIGDDSLHYRACAPGMGCSEATVRFRVALERQTITTLQRLTVPFYQESFGLDDEIEAFNIDFFPQNGTVFADSAREAIVYVPDSAFTGLDSVRLTACDELPSDCQTVTFLITVIDTCNSLLCVLPGDANRDGRVDEDDLVGIGWSFGETGFERDDDGTAFGEQPASDWRFDVAGTNGKYADMNGDGMVAASDTSILALNYGLEARGLYTPTGLAPSNVPVQLDILMDTLLYGDTVFADVRVGTAVQPALDLYGISATLGYSAPPGRRVRKVDVRYGDSWIAGPSDPALTFTRVDTLSGRVAFALTRTDRMGVSGFGSVVQIALITEDNIGERPGSLALTLESGILTDGRRWRRRVPGTAVDVPLPFRTDHPRALPAEDALFPNRLAVGSAWNLVARDLRGDWVLLDTQGKMVDAGRWQEGRARGTAPGHAGVYCLVLRSEGRAHARSLMMLVLP